MLRQLLPLAVALSFAAVPALAQNAQGKLAEADNYFRQNNYFMGVSCVSEVCSMLRANPSAMSKSYSAVAKETVDNINRQIRDAMLRKDVPNATRMAYAEQPLLKTMSEWEPQNPLWHFQQGVMFETMSGLRNDQYPEELKSAIREFDLALSKPGNDAIRQNATKQRDRCQRVLKKREVEIVQFKKTHPQHRPQIHRNDKELWFCANCGTQLTTQKSRCTSCGF